MEPDNSIPPTNSTPSGSKEIRALSTDELLPFSIPDYELLKPIGKGSYGTVWLARNIMGVYRAVKVIYRKSFKEKAPYDRELSGIRSFEPISRSHEGFVDILHVGINHERECFYYVMELGDDEKSGQYIDPTNYSPNTLQKKITASGTLPFDECLQLGIVLSDALLVLHKHRLVHRDVKPSNIIFVNGVPKLADIGLVAGIGEAGSYVGTQGFIPPEGPGSVQADIFSLGKVLYEACTGKDRQDFPDLPTRLYDLEERDRFLELNEVVVQACQNDLNKRYESAWDMHSDLLVLAKGRSVKRLKVLEMRFARVKRWAIASGAALLLTAVIGYPIYREQRTAAAAHEQQVGIDVGYGNRVVESGDVLGALPYFAEATRLANGNSTEEVAQRLRFGSTLAQSPKLERVWSIGAETSDCKISPDNKRIVISRLRGGIEEYDLITGESCSPIFDKLDHIHTVSYSPNGRFIVAGSQGNSISVWSTRDFKVVKRFPNPGGALGAAFSPDSRWIAVACTNGLIKLWTAETGPIGPPRLFQGHTNAVQFAAFSHDGNYIASASRDGTVRLWDLKTGRQIGKPFVHGQWVYHVAFSPDDKRIATACADYRARLWDIATGEQLLTDMRHDDVVYSVEFSPDNRLVLTASLDGTARIWRADDGEPLSANLVLHHPTGLACASFSTDCQRIATACVDGTVCVWNLAGCLVPPVPIDRYYSGDGTRFLSVSNETIGVFDSATSSEVARIPVKGMSLKGAELNRNGRCVIGRSETQWQVWQAATGDKIGPAIKIPKGSKTAVVSEDGRILAAYYSNLVQTWDVVRGTELSEPLTNARAIHLVTFQPNGVLLAVASGSDLYVWNATNSQLAFPPLVHPRRLSGVAFSPDGKYLATCCQDGQVVPWYAQVWSASTGKSIGTKLWHADGVLSVCFSPDGKRVVTGGEDHYAFIWDVISGQRLGHPLKHSEKVRTAVFSSDGRRVLTGCDDGTVRLWDADNGNAITPPLRHSGGIMEVKFIPGGHRILAVGSDKRSSIWNLPVDQRSVDDIKQLASLLSGEISLGAENPRATPLSSPEEVWRRLHALYPETFAVSAREIAAWQEFEARQAENEHQQFAAAFYTNLMAVTRTNNAVKVAPVEKAKEQLEENLH